MTTSYFVTISVTINQLKPLDQTHPRSSKNPMFDISWMAEVSDFQISSFPRFQSSADLLLILVSRSDRGTEVAKQLSVNFKYLLDHGFEANKHDQILSRSHPDLLLILVSRSDRGTGVETESLVAHRSVIRAARRAG